MKIIQITMDNKNTPIQRNKWLYTTTGTVFDDWHAAKKMLGTNRARRLIKEQRLIIYNE